MNNKKWFSIIEIIITVSIIVLLAVIWISSKRWYDEKVNNTKVISDTQTINSAFVSYIQENATIPMPWGNTNFFKKDTSYSHSYDDVDTFWVYGSLTEETLPKKYLDNLPLDPRTNTYYSYGKTKETNQFEVASIQIIDAIPISKVVWNYTAENWPYNLIREYNWSNFVYNWSKINFPYNPDELILVATDKNWNVYREWDIIDIALNWDVTKNWKPEIIYNILTWLELFFSDWSVSILETNSRLTLNKLNFKWTDNLNSLVKLWLETGKIWTKATKLNDESQFEVYTTDSSAAVRWTIFWVVKNTDNTETILIEWKIDVTKNTWTVMTGAIEVLKWEPIEKVTISSSTSTISPTTPTGIIVPTFSKNDDIRSDDTELSIKNIESATIPDATNSCNTFEIGWVCMDHENNLSGWKLHAYAPYNTAWDLNMYGSWSTTYSITTNIANNDFSSLNTWEKWILIGTGQYLKYSYNNSTVWLENHNWSSSSSSSPTSSSLNWDFAIEMNVRVSTGVLNNNYYLIHSWDDIKLFIKNWTLYFNNISSILWSDEFITLISNWFHKITLINEEWILKVKVDDTLFLLTHTITNTINEIVIWAFQLWLIYILQINDMIDYVKIYKKSN